MADTRISLTLRDTLCMHAMTFADSNGLHGMLRAMSFKTKVDGFQCQRCQHKWVPRFATIRPKTCPKCRSVYWETLPRRTAKKDR